MTEKIVHTMTVGKCPACGIEIKMRISADVEKINETKGRIDLQGKITGAQTIPHDCIPKVTRGRGGGM